MYRRRSPVNTGASWPDLDQAWLRVRQMQRKLHQWAIEDSGRRFDDVFNLVYDPSFLVVAWDRVRSNRGSRSAGIDGVTPRQVGARSTRMLAELREELKARQFTPVAVRETMIPKANGKSRATSTRASSSWAGASSARSSQERPSGTSTPGRRRSR